MDEPDPRSPYANGIAFTEGEYVPVEDAKIALLDWCFLRSDANQDTISVWKGLFFRLEDHLDRCGRDGEIASHSSAAISGSRRGRGCSRAASSRCSRSRAG